MKITVERKVAHSGYAHSAAHYLFKVNSEIKLAIRIVKHEWPGLGGTRTFLVYDYNDHCEKLTTTVCGIYILAGLSIEDMDKTYAPYDYKNHKPLPSAWPKEWFEELL